MSGRKISPDRLFEALDGRKLRVQGLDWRLEVYGVFDQAERRWVQLALDGDRDERHKVVTLRLTPGQGPRHAMRSLSSWLAAPTAPAANGAVLHHVA